MSVYGLDHATYMDALNAKTHGAHRETRDAARARLAELEAQAASVRELAADYVVLDAYDQARGRRPFDMTGGRRAMALRRLEAKLNDAREQARRAPAGIPDDLLIARREDTVTAVVRMARKRLQRHDAASAVVNSVAEVARALHVPAALELAERRRAANDERYGGNITGGSRTRGGRAYRPHH